MSKVIKMDLTVSSIDRAINELEKYKKSLDQKAEILRKRIAARVQELSQTGFSNSLVDDVFYGSPHIADVTVTVKNGSNISVVIAKGQDAIWVEFGAGVFHNGPAGSSPNPNGAKVGYTIGSYGKGHGARPAWGFVGDDGEIHISRGTPATMPMYNAMRQVESEILAIAREVFS